MGAVPVVAAGAAVVAVVAAGALIAIAMWRRREWLGGRRLALGRGAAERSSGRRDDPGGLGTHAQHATAAGGEDLEVEIVQTDPEGFAGFAKGLLDGLA
jgi:hypothetical protein